MEKGPVRTAGFDVNVDYQPSEAEVIVVNLDEVLEHARAANVQTKHNI